MKLRVPSRFESASIESVNFKHFPWIRDYIKNWKQNVESGIGLLLSGPPGRGKTWAMAALTRKHVDVGWQRGDHEFSTAPDMFDRLNDFEESVDTYRDQAWLETYSTIPWLVVNDLGKEYRGGKLAEQVPFKLGRILRARSERCLVTHITTNLTGEELTATYGSSITSLLSEMMLFGVVAGPDRRREKHVDRSVK